MRRSLLLWLLWILGPVDVLAQDATFTRIQLETAVLSHFKACGESYFAEQHLVLTTGEVGDNSLGTWEFRGYHSDLAFQPISEADRLNGIQARGVYRYQWAASRQRTPGRSPSSWVAPGVESILFEVKGGEPQQLSGLALRGTRPAVCPNAAEDAALLGARQRARTDSALIRAVATRSADGVRDALQRGARPNVIVERMPALHAAMTGNLQDLNVFSELLNQGADPNEPNERGETPLMTLVRNHLYFDLWGTPLILRGADPLKRDSAGRDVFDHLAQSARAGDTALLRSLRQLVPRTGAQRMRFAQLFEGEWSGREVKSSLQFGTPFSIRLEHLTQLPTSTQLLWAPSPQSSELEPAATYSIFPLSDSVMLLVCTTPRHSAGIADSYRARVSDDALSLEGESGIPIRLRRTGRASPRRMVAAESTLEPAVLSSLVGNWDVTFRNGSSARLRVVLDGSAVTARMAIRNGKASEVEENLQYVPGLDGGGFVLQGQGYTWKKSLTGVARLLSPSPDSWDVGTYTGFLPGASSELKLHRTTATGGNITWTFRRASSP